MSDTVKRDSENLKQPSILDVRKKVSSFLKEALKVRDIKIIKTLKEENGWETLTEVYEDSAFIQELGLNTRVKDRNLYEIKLAEDLEVIAFEKVRSIE
ncbi:hypothetical protein OO006_12635 [Prosthecochloris sp. SCSIO W1101]|uniref:hypothetical protein n=1 Tax=Prosthecochloris sp. SCSIO W1101 TaxID=2992242 RepID=UPI00223E328D|nr:hypothetical protein [Prosthecochloris sp. SCSIO W1101]UZJ41176.1 hypothetical protein OO006_12635 [Prosthecochloris sp. SCSIO W1101]